MLSKAILNISEMKVTKHLERILLSSHYSKNCIYILLMIMKKRLAGIITSANKLGLKSKKFEVYFDSADPFLIMLSLKEKKINSLKDLILYKV